MTPKKAAVLIVLFQSFAGNALAQNVQLDPEPNTGIVANRLDEANDPERAAISLAIKTPEGLRVVFSARPCTFFSAMGEEGAVKEIMEEMSSSSIVRQNGFTAETIEPSVRTAVKNALKICPGYGLGH